MRSLAWVAALLLCLPPLAAALPPPAAEGATLPDALTGAMPPGLLEATRDRDAPAMLRAIAGLGAVSGAQRLLLEGVARAAAQPGPEAMLALGELQFLGRAMPSPVLAAPDAVEAVQALFKAARATPEPGVLEAVAALPPPAQEVLAVLAAAEAFALQAAQEAFAGFSPEELELLASPGPPAGLLAEVGWEPLLGALRVQLAALAFADERLERVGPQPDMVKQCGVLYFALDSGDDVHTCDYLLAVDASGDDLYLNNAGGTGADKVPKAAMMLDRWGNDRYLPVVTGTAGVVGGAVLGSAALWDHQGRDTYAPVILATTSQNALVAVVGAGQVGAGALVDLGGPDTYEARGETYAAAMGGSRHGVGLLYDGGSAGDLYNITLDSDAAGQGGTDGGAGILVDLGGDDRYLASIETRVGVKNAVAGGADNGLGLLLDYGGNDVYRSLFLGTGMGSGSANGGGLSKGVGVLLDKEGDDWYENHGMMDSEANGGAGYGAVGVLLDLGGNDVSLGTLWMTGSLNGASDLGVGVYVNAGGDDVYDATFCHPEAGGVNGGSWGGVGLLLDLGGFDLYRDTVVHGMPMDSGEPCMMMMTMENAGEWRADETMLLKGEGHPVRLATGAQMDDTMASWGVAPPTAPDPRPWLPPLPG